MFTVCPKCTLTLVVTTVDLRAGQGYVRCGRCANVFNALIALREGDPNTGLSDTGKQRLVQSQPQQPVHPALGAGVAMEPEPDPEPEPEPEPAETESGTEIVLSGEGVENEEPSLEFDAAATDVSEIFIAPPEAEHDTTSGNYESVVLGEDGELVAEPEIVQEAEAEADDLSHTDTIAADDWSLLDDDEPPADAESVIEESPLAAEPDPSWVQEMFAEAEAQADAARTRTAEREALATEEPDEPEPAAVRAARDASGAAPPSNTVLEPLLAAPVKRRVSWQYVTAVCALGVALVLQIVHHNRQSLVLDPILGPPLSKVYSWFGATPMPRWDLTAYSVKQLGAESEGTEGTRLRVRLSVHNESTRVQPLPLLRLTLQDRYGNPVATRDLEPHEYLPVSVADQRLLEPDKRIDAELHVIDPSRTAFGFEIDACLRSENGTVGCSNDARRRAAG